MPTDHAEDMLMNADVDMAAKNGGARMAKDVSTIKYDEARQHSVKDDDSTVTATQQRGNGTIAAADNAATTPVYFTNDVTFLSPSIYGR